MRGGWAGNAKLQRWLERGNTKVHPIVEAVVTEAEDLKDSFDDWNGADDVSALTVLREGGVRLAGSSSVLAEYPSTATPGFHSTDLDGPFGSPLDVVIVEWDSDDAENIPLHSLVANLDPAFGGSKEVDTWVAQVFRVREVSFRGETVETFKEFWELEPRTAQVRVTAAETRQDVTFNFAPGAAIPTVGGPPLAPDNAGVRKPTSVIMIWALGASGGEVENVAWWSDSSLAETTFDGHRVAHWTLKRPEDATSSERSSRYETTGPTQGLPLFTLNGRSYTEQVATFTTNPVDLGLGRLPDLEKVEFVFEGEEPSSSVLKAEVWDGSTWVEFVDGDVAGVDNTADGGKDLTSVAEADTYDVRVTLTPSANNLVTPTARRIGVRSIDSEFLDNLVKVGSLSVNTDPVTGVTSLPETSLQILRDGIRDYRDLGSELLSENYIGDLLFRIWAGHADLPRSVWLHLDDFQPEDQDSPDASVNLELVHPTARANRKIPVVDTVTGERTAIEFASQTPKAIFADLLDRMGIAGRLRGPEVEEAGFTLSKTIKDPREGYRELQRIAWLAGGTVIPSQGRLKFVTLYGDDAPVAVFPREEIDPRSVNTGYARRIPEFAVPFGWDARKDNGNGGYSGESHASVQNAVDNLGLPLVEKVEEVEDEIARYIENEGTGDSPSSTVADDVATRVVTHMGVGIPLWTFRTAAYPRPWVEIGDRVAVQTDRFVARDPHDSTRHIRGLIWALARVVAVHDFMGRAFTVWPQAYADLLPGSVTIRRVAFASPEIRSVAGTFDDETGALTLTVQGNGDTGSVKAAGDDTTQPSKPTVRAQPAQATDADRQAEFTLPGTYDVGDEVLVSVLGFEFADGSGAESVEMFKRKFLREEAAPFAGLLRADTSAGDGTADVYGEVTGPSFAFPVTQDVFEDSPAGTLVGTVVHNSSATEALVASGRTLPEKAHRKWYSRLTDAQGNVIWSGFTTADRDTIPDVHVARDDFKAEAVLRMEYDDDVTEVVLTTPAGLKTYSGLSGGGLLTYTVGTTQLDDLSTEDLLETDEVRTGYAVDVKGGGTTIRAWSGPLRGLPKNPPTVEARFELSTDQETADVYGEVTSPVSENLRLHFRDGNVPATWSLVQGDGDSTPRYVASGTELGPSAWFYDGSTFAQKLSAVALLRDDVKVLHLWVTGETTGMKSPTDSLTLPVLGKPWLEDSDMTFSEDSKQITLAAVGGARTQSAIFEIASDEDFTTILHSEELSIVDGQKVKSTYAIEPTDRQTTRFGRVTPYSGPLSAGSVTGIAGEAGQKSVYIPDPNDPTEGTTVRIIGYQWISWKLGYKLQISYQATNSVNDLQVDYAFSPDGTLGGILPKGGIRSQTVAVDQTRFGGSFIVEEDGAEKVFPGASDHFEMDIVPRNTDESPTVIGSTLPWDGISSPGGGDTEEGFPAAGMRGRAQDGSLLQSDREAKPRPMFELRPASGDENRLERGLRDVHDMGSVSGTVTPDFTNGPVQIASLSADATLKAPTGQLAGETFHMRIVLNGNILTFDSADWEAPNGLPSSLAGVVAFSALDFGTGKLTVFPAGNVS